MALDKINRVGSVSGSDPRPVERPASAGKKGPDSYAVAGAGLDRITAGAAAPVGPMFRTGSPAVDPIVGWVRASNIEACKARRAEFVAAIERKVRGS